MQHKLLHHSFQEFINDQEFKLSKPVAILNDELFSLFSLFILGLNFQNLKWLFFLHSNLFYDHDAFNLIFMVHYALYLSYGVGGVNY